MDKSVSEDGAKKSADSLDQAIVRPYLRDLAERRLRREIAKERLEINRRKARMALLFARAEENRQKRERESRMLAEMKNVLELAIREIATIQWVRQQRT